MWNTASPARAVRASQESQSSRGRESARGARERVTKTWASTRPMALRVHSDVEWVGDSHGHQSARLLPGARRHAAGPPLSLPLRCSIGAPRYRGCQHAVPGNADCGFVDAAGRVECRLDLEAARSSDPPFEPGPNVVRA